MDPTAVQRELTRSILTSDTLSTLTRNVLFQHDLRRRWRGRPARRDRRDARRWSRASNARRERHLRRWPSCRSPTPSAAATPPITVRRRSTPGCSSFLRATDRRRATPSTAHVRVAADLYNRGLARGFAPDPNGEFVPREGTLRTCRSGTSTSTSTRPARPRRAAGSRTSCRSRSSRCEGCATRYRSSGIGAPLAASTEPSIRRTGYDDFVEPWVKVPVTALLRMDDVRGQLANGRVNGRLTLEVTVARDDASTIDGAEVPLETETTASLAYTLRRVADLAARARRLPAAHGGDREEHPARFADALSARSASRSCSCTAPPRARDAGRR